MAMVEVQLITYRELEPWSDQIIEKTSKPPFWIIEISTRKFLGDLLQTLQTFQNSEPFEELPVGKYTDERVASLFLRYRRRELSWASFLQNAGRVSDPSSGRLECEYFYELLNRYEESNFSEALEASQKEAVELQYGEVLHSVGITYNLLRQYRKPHTSS